LRVATARNFLTARRIWPQNFAADPCSTWPEHGLGAMSLRDRPFEKISLFLKFCSHTF